MTHVSGTSGHVNRPANMNHACSSGSAMTHIRWDGTMAVKRRRRLRQHHAHGPAAREGGAGAVAGYRARYRIPPGPGRGINWDTVHAPAADAGRRQARAARHLAGVPAGGG